MKTIPKSTEIVSLKYETSTAIVIKLQQIYMLHRYFFKGKFKF